MSPRGRELDLKLMRRALALARRGRGRVSPNPMVGCVLARGGRVVAEGWHARFGGPHAEARALARAGARARGATAYVSLEPCSHHGKTPPCADALIRAGVRRVVAAMTDPNPRVRGRGLARLRAAGIAVAAGVGEEEARELNRAFATWVRERRPYVVLKAAASLDGRIETAAGRSQWITAPAARALGRRLRREADAILVGVGTVLADDPRLTAPGPGPQPLRVILDSRLRTPARARALRGPGALIASAVPPNGTRRNAEYLRLPRKGGGLDLRALLRALAARGVCSLLVEGGSEVHTAFLEQGLVDELRLFLAPRLLGGAKARSFFEGRGFPLPSGLALSRARVTRVGPDLLVTGRLR